MELSTLYSIADREKVNIYNWHIDNSKGAFININKINAITLNYSRLNHLDEKQLISKQERKANKWAYNTLIPFEDLKLAIKKGMTEIYTLAEYFDVSACFMQKCLVYYLEKYGTLK